MAPWTSGLWPISLGLHSALVRGGRMTATVKRKTLWVIWLRQWIW